MTLLVRDEADVLETHLAYHLAAGVDVVIATDHRSSDGTTEILESYARAGHVQLFREHGERIHQSEWVTRMARFAATEFDADWVINSDADEFWWPRGASLKEVLAAVPTAFGVAYALSRSFVPRADDRQPFSERMIYRLASAAPINDPATSFRPVVKVAHRGDPNVVVSHGNHDVFRAGGARLRAWHPLEVLHLPLRSREQVARKHRNTRLAWERNLRGDLSRAGEALEAGRPEAFYDRVALGDRAVRRGVADGTLVKDTRLRDVLRALSGVHGASGEPGPVARRDEEEALHAVEAACFVEASIVRLGRRLDELGERVAKVENRSGSVSREEQAARRHEGGAL